jgi:hypothetical protein
VGNDGGVGGATGADRAGVAHADAAAVVAVMLPAGQDAADGVGAADAVGDSVGEAVAVGDGDGIGMGSAVGAGVGVGSGGSGAGVWQGAEVIVNVALPVSWPRAPAAARVCGPRSHDVVGADLLMVAVQVLLPPMYVGVATVAQGVPSQVKLTAWVWHGSPADALKLNDAVMPVVDGPWSGVMLKVLGASACTTDPLVMAAIARAAAVTKRRAEVRGNMCLRLSSHGGDGPVSDTFRSHNSSRHRGDHRR